MNEGSTYLISGSFVSTSNVTKMTSFRCAQTTGGGMLKNTQKKVVKSDFQG